MTLRNLFLKVVNSSINLPIYYSVGSTFREALKKAFGKGCLKNRQNGEQIKQNPMKVF